MQESREGAVEEGGTHTTAGQPGREVWGRVRQREVG